MASVIAGIGWDMVGAISAATFYVPLSKVKKWSWETMWTVAGFFSWVLLPLCVTLCLLPNFWSFYTALDSRVVLLAFAFGAMWGIGNVSFGLTIRYLGMSLGIGTAIGITMVAGTILPPILHGQAMRMVTTKSGLCATAGILVAVLGIGIVSFAGQLKEGRARNGEEGVQPAQGPAVGASFRRVFFVHVSGNRRGRTDQGDGPPW